MWKIGRYVEEEGLRENGGFDNREEGDDVVGCFELVYVCDLSFRFKVKRVVFS